MLRWRWEQASRAQSERHLFTAQTAVGVQGGMTLIRASA